MIIVAPGMAQSHELPDQNAQNAAPIDLFVVFQIVVCILFRLAQSTASPFLGHGINPQP